MIGGWPWASASCGAPRADRDVSREGLGTHSRCSVSYLEREPLRPRSADPVLAGLEGDRKVAFDGTAPGGNGELGSCILRYPESNVAGVRDELIPAVTIDGAVVAQIATHGMRPNESGDRIPDDDAPTGGFTLEVAFESRHADVAAHGLDLPIAGEHARLDV